VDAALSAVEWLSQAGTRATLVALLLLLLLLLAAVAGDDRLRRRVS